MLSADQKACLETFGFIVLRQLLDAAEVTIIKREAEEIFERFHTLVTTSVSEDVEIPDLGKLAVFSGVREYPMRVKCATLAWHTLHAALENRGETISPETATFGRV